MSLERAKSEKAIPVGTLRNVSFANIVATRAGKTGCSIVGLPGHCVENVSLSNVTIRSEGGGKRQWASAAIKERANAYPEATMFGKLPAHGLYCRHVRGLTLTDVRLLTDEPDGRHALVLDDVAGGEHQRFVVFARRGRRVGRPADSGPQRFDPRLPAR